MKRPILFIPFILFIGLAFVFLIQLNRNAEGDSPTKLESVLIGKPVPTFRLQDLAEEGKLHDQSFFNGEPFLLNVWATWCPTCYSEHNFLNQLARDGVKIIGLNYKDDRLKAVDWLNKLGNPYVLSLFDGSGMLGLDLGVYGAPETFFIDAKGIIRYRHVGDVNAINWANDLKPLYKTLVAEVKK